RDGVAGVGKFVANHAALQREAERNLPAADAEPAAEFPTLRGLCDADALEQFAGIRRRVLGAKTRNDCDCESGEDALYTERRDHRLANLCQPRMDQKLLFLINREWASPGLDWAMVIA